MKYLNIMDRTISVIIPVRLNIKVPSALDNLRQIDYPKDKMEIFSVSGFNPSGQRNAAAKIAKGEILYFLNSNAQSGIDIFRGAMDIFSKDETVAGVGGPDIIPKDSSFMQCLFDYAMGSYFAHWKMRARYSQIGDKRISDEKELILSNLAIRKDIYLKAKGFNETIYPNEENELITRIIKMGYKFIYNPELVVHRKRRSNIASFIRQFYRYGKGRSKQVFVEGTLKNLYFFMPSFLSIYIILLPFLRKDPVIFIPLYIYMSLAMIDAIYISFKNRKLLVFLLPFIYMTMHISYGAGMLSGIFQKMIKRKDNDPVVESDCKITRIQ